MKTSFVSSHSVSHALRYQMMRMQAELVQRQTEATTGRLGDPGVVIGARAGTTFSMSREIERLKGLTDSNGLASNRLVATQDNLDFLNGIAQELRSPLMAAISSDGDPALVLPSAKRALQSMTSVINANLNGEYLFAGINTDVRPLNDFTDPTSPNKVQFDTLFTGFFGFPQTDPAVANITATEMSDFLDTVEASFMGAGWTAAWSNASDQKITSRIALNETAETSATANDAGIRKLAMAASTLTELMQFPLGDAARNVLYTRGNQLVSEAIADMSQTQAEIGLIQARIESANQRISAQKSLFGTMIVDLEGVDEFEAAARVTEILTQIETSYALTARIQQLSLARYLP